MERAATMTELRFRIDEVQKGFGEQPPLTARPVLCPDRRGTIFQKFLPPGEAGEQTQQKFLISGSSDQGKIGKWVEPKEP